MTLNDLGLSTDPNPNETLCPGESEKAREDGRLRLSTDQNLSSPSLDLSGSTNCKIYTPVNTPTYSEWAENMLPVVNYY